MWYTRIVDSRNFLFFYNSDISIFIDSEEVSHPYYQMYLLWVQEGNVPQEWESE